MAGDEGERGADAAAALESDDEVGRGVVLCGGLSFSLSLPLSCSRTNTHTQIPSPFPLSPSSLPHIIRVLSVMCWSLCRARWKSRMGTCRTPSELFLSAFSSLTARKMIWSQVHTNGSCPLYRTSQVRIEPQRIQRVPGRGQHCRRRCRIRDEEHRQRAPPLPERHSQRRRQAQCF